MIYAERDLLTEERNAWQRGDYALADALALAIDAEAWSDHNSVMRQRLDNLRQLIEQTARVSGRELLLERVGEMEALIDEAEQCKEPSKGYHG